MSSSMLVHDSKSPSIKQMPLDSTLNLPITIDGFINIGEWGPQIRTHKLQYNLDVDNSGDPANVDGFNYIYTAEDRQNLYVGLDLCSDQTNDITGEWVGLWLLTNSISLDNDWIKWGKNINKGVESLIYNVSGNQIMQFSDPILINNILENIDDPEDLIVANGTCSDPISYLSNNFGDYFNVSSISDGTQHVVKLDVVLNASEWFEVFQEEELNAIQNVQVHLRAKHSQNVQSCKLILWDEQNNSPQPPYPNSNQVYALPTSTNFFDIDIFATSGNLSANNLFRFSIWCNNSAAFNTTFDALYLFLNKQSGSLSNINVHYAYSTIKNFQIVWGFGTSENNASNHRMFEIKIPKSELNEFGSTSEYKLLVGGYGTMSFYNTNYWVMPEYPYINVVDVSKYISLSYATQSELGEFTVSSDAQDPDVDGEVLFTWTVSPNAISYKLYLSPSELTTINDTMVPLASNILTTNKSVKINESGTYYAVVVAENYWGQKISNILTIKVQINPDTPPAGPMVSIDGFYGIIPMIPLFMVIGMKYYRKKIA